MPGQPYLIRTEIADSWLAALRASARLFADLHGAPTPTGGPAAVSGSSWRFADPSHESFGEVVKDLVELRRCEIRKIMPVLQVHNASLGRSESHLSSPLNVTPSVNEPGHRRKVDVLLTLSFL